MCSWPPGTCWQRLFGTTALPLGEWITAAARSQLLPATVFKVTYTRAHNLLRDLKSLVHGVMHWLCMAGMYATDSNTRMHTQTADSEVRIILPGCTAAHPAGARCHHWSDLQGRLKLKHK
jgi:hypothetical protein